jgi:hypothetical protein
MSVQHLIRIRKETFVLYILTLQRHALKAAVVPSEAYLIPQSNSLAVM